MKKFLYFMAFAAVFAFASCSGAKTTEEKVEEKVEATVEEVKNVVEESTEKVEEVVEETKNVAENETLLEAYEKLVKKAEELKTKSNEKDVLGSVKALAELKKEADNVGSKVNEAKDSFTVDQKAKYEELKNRLEEAFKK